MLTGGGGLVLLPWVGDCALFTAVIALRGEHVEASVEGPSVQVESVNAEELANVVAKLLSQPPPTAAKLAELIENREIDKWDWVLDDDLANEAAGARLLDIDGAWRMLERVHTDLTRATNLERTAEPVTATSPPSMPPPPPPSPSPVSDLGFQLRTAEFLDQEFCVIDVETTGFSPRLGDRIIEVAAVRVRGDGTVLSEWSTLINPGRDVGATHIHGITAADVADAPTFAEVAGDLLGCLDGAVLVAHNIRFDHDFVAAEFLRAGYEIPPLPALCTLALGDRVQPGGSSRRLGACCEKLGIDVSAAHTAGGDASATAQLLACYLRMAVERGLRTLADVGCTPLYWPDSLPPIAPSLLHHQRGGGERRVGAQGDYLARLVDQLDTAATDPDTAAYLELLDRALEDRRLSDVEADALAETAAAWGLDSGQVHLAHENYFDAVLAVAAGDGVITDLEYKDLQLVGALLKLDRNTVERRINDAQLAETTEQQTTTAVSLAGMSVCFTGALYGRIDAELITRTQAQQFAENAGLVVKGGVSKGLDLLVVADPDSQSAKARKARDYGTRVMAEQVFWSTIGITTD